MSAPRPRISLIINSCAKRANEQPSDYSLSSGRKPYGKRYKTLHSVVLPRYWRTKGGRGPDEIIVAGEFEEGSYWRYVEAPSKHFSCIDALHQRQAGADAASGDLLVFQHDDHYFPMSFWQTLRQNAKVFSFYDLLNPIRAIWKKGQRREHPVNRGAPPYISGHFAIMTRNAVERVPWTDVQKIIAWDQPHTALCNERLRWAKAPMLVAYDLELGEIPPL